QRCFGRLTVAWRQQFPEATEIPRWGELSRAGVAIYDLDFDAILAAMSAVTISDEGDCYRCFPPDPGIETAALGTGEAAALGANEAAALGASASASSGAGESALSGTASASASLTFTLDPGASRSFFQDRTTLTPLGRPVAVSLANPSGGPVLSHFSTVLPCPAAPSGTLSGLYLPWFSTNLVSGADLQDAGVHQFTPASQRVTHCSDARTGRHLATFTRRLGLSLYTLTTEFPPVSACGQVAASGQVFAAASRSGPESAPCSCRLLSHETLLWHHRLSHPSLPRLRGMASRVLLSGLPRSLPPLPLGPGPSCVPCVEGRLRLPRTPLSFPRQRPRCRRFTWTCGARPASRGQGHERYFLLVVDDYSRYTTVFPLRSKGDVTKGIDRLDPRSSSPAQEELRLGLPVLRLHSDRGGEFSSGLLRAYCRSRASVRDLSADKLSPSAAPCVFLGFPPDAPGWQSYHPSSRRVLSSQDVTFDESTQSSRVEVAGDSGTTAGAEPGGADSGVLSLGGTESGGAATGGAEPGGAETGGAEPGGPSPGGAERGGATLELLSLGSCASGLPGAGGVLLELVRLRLLRVLVLPVVEVLVLGVLELFGLRVLLEPELLRVLARRLLLSVLAAVPAAGVALLV
ncbi:unnamed protein product, partial [Closterium sp. NIES-65]